MFVGLNIYSQWFNASSYTNFEISKCGFYYCTTEYSGGAVLMANEKSHLEISDSFFMACKAFCTLDIGSTIGRQARSGGAFSVGSLDCEIKNTCVLLCESAHIGSGFYVSTKQDLLMADLSLHSCGIEGKQSSGSIFTDGYTQSKHTALRINSTNHVSSGHYGGAHIGSYTGETTISMVNIVNITAISAYGAGGGPGTKSKTEMSNILYNRKCEHVLIIYMGQFLYSECIFYNPGIPLIGGTVSSNILEFVQCTLDSTIDRAFATVNNCVENVQHETKHAISVPNLCFSQSAVFTDALSFEMSPIGLHLLIFFF